MSDQPTYLLIKNARVVDCRARRITPADILIEKSGDGKGKIARIAKTAHKIEIEDDQSGRVSSCNAHSKLVCSAFCDLWCASFPAYSTSAEDARSASLAAQAGGYSSLLLRPEKEDADVAHFKNKIESLRGNSLCSLRFCAPLMKSDDGGDGGDGGGSNSIADLEALVDAGACAFSDCAGDYIPSSLLREALIRAKALGVPVFLSRSDPSFADTGFGEGSASRLLGIPPTPALAQELALLRSIALCEDTGCRVHIPIVSSAREAALIREAKARGVNISASTAPQYFSLCENDLLFFGASAKLSPPLRLPSDRDAIADAIADGTIDFIVSDHTPCTDLEKSSSLLSAAPGAIGLESAFSVAVTHLYLREKIDLFRLISLFTSGFEVLFGEDCSLCEGSRSAGLVIPELEGETVITENTLRSRAHNTPFLGTSLQGGIAERFIFQ